jgi:hypothetical protein
LEDNGEDDETMNTTGRIVGAKASLIAIVCIFLLFSLAAKWENSLDVSANKDTVVRFFYLPPNDYLHPALFLRVAADGYSRINTEVFIDHEGRTTYISLEEMRALVAKLALSKLSWEKTGRAQSPREVGFGETTSDFEITVYSPSETYQAEFQPRVVKGHYDSKKICSTLAPLDSTIKQPRALWEFQLYRRDYRCSVPGFDRSAYPDHDIGGK